MDYVPINTLSIEFKYILTIRPMDYGYLQKTKLSGEGQCGTYEYRLEAALH